jgi:hypothetical protein
MIRPDLDDLARMSEDALRLIDPDDLAFYFASGKSEGLIRDHIATFMHKNLSLSGPEYVTREWKRHDLAVIYEDEPLILIEGKSWIYHDAYRKSKLLTDKNSILNGALRDAKKLIEGKKRYDLTEIYISTILYGVDTSTNHERSKMGVTYYESHAQGIKSAGSFHDLNGIGRSHLTQLHQAFGITRRFPLRAGSYHGMQVEADMFLTKVEPESLPRTRKLSQSISVDFESRGPISFGGRG